MDAPHDPAPHDDARDVEVQVRRSPKYGIFMAIGALVGILVAWAISSAMGPGVNAEGERVDTSPVVGLSLVVGFVVGGGLGGLVAILIDRRLSRRTRTLVAEHVVVDEVVEAEPVEPEHADAVEGSFEPVQRRDANRDGDGPGAEPGDAGTDRTRQG